MLFKKKNKIYKSTLFYCLLIWYLFVKSYMYYLFLFVILQLEFAVQMPSLSYSDKIQKQLNENGISNSDILVSYETGTVIVNTNLPSSVILNSIEKTGTKAVLKGYGSTTRKILIFFNSYLCILYINNMHLFVFILDKNLGAAVAMLGGSTGHSNLGINGVIRFVQINENECVIDGTVDGLSPGKHGIHVYEYGDLSNGCKK